MSGLVMFIFISGLLIWLVRLLFIISGRYLGVKRVGFGLSFRFL